MRGWVSLLLPKEEAVNLAEFCSLESFRSKTTWSDGFRTPMRIGAPLESHHNHSLACVSSNGLSQSRPHLSPKSQPCLSPCHTKKSRQVIKHLLRG